ncbi:hypothetical protein HMPREF3226_02828 [Prevotella corporis]|uniref:Uncharacterized protein n=1 Tax=Prevotella corporis TaxID=28128 RepID=A0A133PT38_9BACT|nr:hypothetical protein HMPREF3226_02828 [Prevotella corporis]
MSVSPSRCDESALFASSKENAKPQNCGLAFLFYALVVMAPHVVRVWIMTIVGGISGSSCS